MRTLTHPGPESADYGRRERSEWLDVDWSAHVRRVTVAGTEIEYADIGEGDDPILWIHGLGACWQTWLENLPFFSQTHRCIALDLPGFGRSDMRDDISIDRYGEIVGEFCDTLGIRQATVVGNSTGGVIGAELAIKFPERVERLALVSAAVFWQEYRRAKPLVALAQTTEASVGRAIVHGQPALVRRPRLRALALAFGGFRYPHLLSRELQVELLLTARRTAGFVPALQSLGDYPLRDELPRIACPTLVVWGTDDPMVSVRHAHELESLIPNSRKEIFERTGHVPMLERPDRFNRVLAEFITETGDQDGEAGARALEDATARDRAEA